MPSRVKKVHPEEDPQKISILLPPVTEDRSKKIGAKPHPNPSALSARLRNPKTWPQHPMAWTELSHCTWWGRQPRFQLQIRLETLKVGNNFGGRTLHDFTTFKHRKMLRPVIYHHPTTGWWIKRSLQPLASKHSDAVKLPHFEEVIGNSQIYQQTVNSTLPCKPVQCKTLIWAASAGGAAFLQKPRTTRIFQQQDLSPKHLNGFSNISKDQIGFRYFSKLCMSKNPSILSHFIPESSDI